MPEVPIEMRPTNVGATAKARAASDRRFCIEDVPRPSLLQRGHQRLPENGPHAVRSRYGSERNTVAESDSVRRCPAHHPMREVASAPSNMFLISVASQRAPRGRAPSGREQVPISGAEPPTLASDMSRSEIHPRQKAKSPRPRHARAATGKPRFCRIDQSPGSAAVERGRATKLRCAVASWPARASGPCFCRTHDGPIALRPASIDCRGSRWRVLCQLRRLSPSSTASKSRARRRIAKAEDRSSARATGRPASGDGLESRRRFARKSSKREEMIAALHAGRRQIAVTQHRQTREIASFDFSEGSFCVVAAASESQASANRSARARALTIVDTAWIDVEAARSRPTREYRRRGADRVTPGTTEDDEISAGSSPIGKASPAANSRQPRISDFGECCCSLSGLEQAARRVQDFIVRTPSARFAQLRRGIFARSLSTCPSSGNFIAGRRRSRDRRNIRFPTTPSIIVDRSVQQARGSAPTAARRRHGPGCSPRLRPPDKSHVEY